ncbi:hypothetical protein FRB98_004289 [Tulasnella sp. 332]|nr:hypothetical protein FRB98_004289 [Tulasnella sp. 332]
MPSAKISKYIELFILGLVTIFASIELGLTIYERIRISDLAGSSAAHDLDYIIFCAAWTILFCLFWILTSLTVNAGFLTTRKPRIIYFVFTAILWLAAGVLWQGETKEHGCDFGHNMCGINNTIQDFAWTQALKHIIGALTSLKKTPCKTNQASNGETVGDIDDKGLVQEV